jgi:hypothetical protein
MVLSLERLGRSAEAQKLSEKFASFAGAERSASGMNRQAEALYLLGLVQKSRGRGDESRDLMSAALNAMPDYLPARMELRGDVPHER